MSGRNDWESLGKGWRKEEEAKPDPTLIEEPLLKALKAMSGKVIEVVPLINGKMEANLVMDWIEGM